MARTQVNTTGEAVATIGLSSNTSNDSTYDVFVSNQGEGAMRVTITWPSGIGDFFVPPSAHRDRVNIEPGHVLIVDTNEVVQLVAVRPQETTAGDTLVTFTGQKTHVTAASTGNDYLAIGSGLRATS